MKQFFALALVGLMLAGCAPFRGGEQPGYWQHVTEQVRK